MPTSSFKALALVPLLALAACVGGTGGAAAEYRPTLAAEKAPVAPSNGAIYQASYGYAPLTSGSRASQVGDMLTIVLVERTQAQQEQHRDHRPHRRDRPDAADDRPARSFHAHRH